MCWSGITTITMYLVQIYWGCCCHHCRHHITRYFVSFFFFLLLYLFSDSSSLHGTFFSSYSTLCFLSFSLLFISVFVFFFMISFQLLFIGVVVAFRTCAISYTLAWNINIWILCSTTSVFIESLWRKHQTHQHSASVFQSNRTYHYNFSQCVTDQVY